MKELRDIKRFPNDPALTCVRAVVVTLSLLTLPPDPALAATHKSASTHVDTARSKLMNIRKREDELKQRQDQIHQRLTEARKAAETAQQKAKADAAQAASLTSASVDAAQQLEDTQNKLDSLRDDIDDLRDRQAEIRQDLALDAAAIAPMITVARRLDMHPTESLIASPSSSEDSITALLVIRGLARTLEHDAEGLKARRAELDVVDQDLGNRLKEARQLESEQADQKIELSRKMKAARDAWQHSKALVRTRDQQSLQTQAKAEAVDKEVSLLMAEEAAALTALQKEAEKAALRKQQALLAARKAHQKHDHDSSPSGSTIASSTGSKKGAGGLVAGTIITAWGSPTETGPATGMTFSTPSGALVRAPCSGHIDFAGPFRSFGHMLILNCGGNDRFVLAGLEHLEVEDGQNIHKGEGVGAMPSSGKPGTLLVQLRHGTRAINPASRL